MKNVVFRRSLVIGIIALFVGASIVPSISGYIEKTGNQLPEEAPTNFPLNNDYMNVYWKFDECSGNIAYDSSEHGYDGTINGATWTTSGHSGCALVFDGVDDYVSVDAYSEQLGFNKTDDVIYSFWFKSTGEGIIYCITRSWGYNPEHYIKLLSNGSLMFRIWTTECGITLYSDGIYDGGNWHHAEYYFNGITANPTVELYVDDDFDNCATHWLCPIENDDYGKAKIGKHAYYATDYFDGTIDEFKIIKYPGGNKQEPPTISGPTSGEPGVEYDFIFVTEDPEEDEIWLLLTGMTTHLKNG